MLVFVLVCDDFHLALVEYNPHEHAKACIKYLRCVFTSDILRKGQVELRVTIYLISPFQ